MLKSFWKMENFFNGIFPDAAKKHHQEKTGKQSQEKRRNVMISSFFRHSCSLVNQKTRRFYWISQNRFTPAFLFPYSLLRWK